MHGHVVAPVVQQEKSEHAELFCMKICRAWQLFDWVRTLPEGHGLQRLCDANTYSTMITLCGPWQQLRRALQLVAEMRNRSLECGIQVLC